MRLRMIVSALVALPMLLGGCGGAGTTPASGGRRDAVARAVPWHGRRLRGAPRRVPSRRRVEQLSPSAPWWRSCRRATLRRSAGPPTAQVLIPMIVTPGKGSLTVQWPAWYGPDYRVTAVDQRLVSGAQPPPTWVTVPAGGGCTVTATMTGLQLRHPVRRLAGRAEHATRHRRLPQPLQRPIRRRQAALTPVRAGIAALRRGPAVRRRWCCGRCTWRRTGGRRRAGRGRRRSCRRSARPGRRSP